MKKWAEISIISATISLILGMVARALITPIWGVSARAFVLFSVTCLLFAITLILLAMLNIQEKK